MNAPRTSLPPLGLYGMCQDDLYLYCCCIKETAALRGLNAVFGKVICFFICWF